jgi:hypothetical protein
MKRVSRCFQLVSIVSGAVVSILFMIIAPSGSPSPGPQSNAAFMHLSCKRHLRLVHYHYHPHKLTCRYFFASILVAGANIVASSIIVGTSAQPFQSRLMARHSSAFVEQRRSARLQKRSLSGADDSQSSEQCRSNALPKAKRPKAKNGLRLENTPRPSSKPPPLAPSLDNIYCLPRTREIQLLGDHIGAVIGVDEAGRGPLAG